MSNIIIHWREVSVKPLLGFTCLKIVTVTLIDPVLDFETETMSINAPVPPTNWHPCLLLGRYSY